MVGHYYVYYSQYTFALAVLLRCGAGCERFFLSSVNSTVLVYCMFMRNCVQLLRMVHTININKTYREYDPLNPAISSFGGEIRREPHLKGDFLSCSRLLDSSVESCLVLFPADHSFTPANIEKIHRAESAQREQSKKSAKADGRKKRWTPRALKKNYRARIGACTLALIVLTFLWSRPVQYLVMWDHTNTIKHTQEKVRKNRV